MRENKIMSKLRTTILKQFLAAAAGLLVVSVLSAGATPVTVQDIGMGSYETVQMTSSTLGTAWVYAGSVNLLVDGMPTTGFCIDPFHWSITGPQSYNTEPLANAPKSPINGMGAATALQIEQLYAHYFTPDISSANAAGLQIAIWELVGGSNFHLNSGNDYGASAMLEWSGSNPNAQAADLMAITGPGQDYLIQSVPDGGVTALMLGGGLAGLGIMRRKFAKLNLSK
jgi:hypothetical protein